MIGNRKDGMQEHREWLRRLGKKEYTLLKMLDYGFWPSHLPLPTERQRWESESDYAKRKELAEKEKEATGRLLELSEDHQAVLAEIFRTQQEYRDAGDIEKIKKEINRQIIQESLERREARKKARKEAARLKSERWKRKKEEEILFVGKGYSHLLHQKQSDAERLERQGMPRIETDQELAALLEIERGRLRGLCYHRDVMKDDHYYRYAIPKKSGGERRIAAPKSILKSAQRKILEKILEKADFHPQAHGFIVGRSVISGAKAHQGGKDFVLNMDIRDFFPTIDFHRVCGMFRAFGYSGYIATLLSMLCTCSERTPIEVRGETLQVGTSARILPQGSPASPMITNILCRRMDRRLAGLASKYGLSYTRYADDISFSGRDGALFDSGRQEDISRLLGGVSHIVSDEGFAVNRAKTRILKQSNRQEITGVVINGESLAVPKPWLKRLRAALHQCRLMKEQGESIPAQKSSEIHGRICWLMSVNPQRYEKYRLEWESLQEEGRKK